jgi:hypothetical protein
LISLDIELTVSGIVIIQLTVPQDIKARLPNPLLLPSIHTIYEYMIKELDKNDEEIIPEPHHKMIRIFVHGKESGVFVELAVWSDELVENVRRMILEKVPGMYLLMRHGNVLKDGDTLITCGIHDGNQIQAWDSIFKNISLVEGNYAIFRL